LIGTQVLEALPDPPEELEWEPDVDPDPEPLAPEAEPDPDPELLEPDAELDPAPASTGLHEVFSEQTWITMPVIAGHRSSVQTPAPAGQWSLGGAHSTAPPYVLQSPVAAQRPYGALLPTTQQTSEAVEQGSEGEQSMSSPPAQAVPVSQSVVPVARSPQQTSPAPQSPGRHSWLALEELLEAVELLDPDELVDELPDEALLELDPPLLASTPPSPPATEKLGAPQCTSTAPARKPTTIEPRTKRSFIGSLPTASPKHARRDRERYERA